jgi:hypothetical protein
MAVRNYGRDGSDPSSGFFGMGSGAGEAVGVSAGLEEDPGFRHVGVEIICTPEVADDIARQLRDAVAEILDGYTDADIIDYGVDQCPGRGPAEQQLRRTTAPLPGIRTAGKGRWHVSRASVRVAWKRPAPRGCVGLPTPTGLLR